MATTTPISLADAPVLVEVWTTHVTTTEAEFPNLAEAAAFVADQDPDGRGWPTFSIWLDAMNLDPFDTVADAEAFIAAAEC